MPGFSGRFPDIHLSTHGFSPSRFGRGVPWPGTKGVAHRAAQGVVVPGCATVVRVSRCAPEQVADDEHQEREREEQRRPADRQDDQRKRDHEVDPGEPTGASPFE